MQINHEFKPVVKSSANMETSKASIEITPHMFQILSAGIYQHPERAVIREPSCNANDAQVEAGTAHIPFKVHLPVQLEPYFEVRDFGTGMTHEQVMKLYVTYGASTKRDSNDVIGGLGIGSKAPFAIAQSFTVTSYKDGTVRRYSIYMEEGVPQVTKLTESKTDEPNGVAVRVAVPMDKIEKFHQEANLVYTHFPVKPDCNRPLVNIYEDMSVLAEEKDRFKIFSGENRTANLHIKTGIVMGNIEYPISLADVIPDLDNVMPQFLRRNITHALIYLPIGSVNIAASRESLQLTDSTKAMVTQVFTEVSESILSSFQDKISGAKHLAEAIKLFREAVGESAYTRGHVNDLMKHIKFADKSLLDWMVEQDECRMTEVIDPVTGAVVTNHMNKPKKCFKYEHISAIRLWGIRGSGKNRLKIQLLNEASEFSLFRNMTADRLKHSIFLIEDRLSKNGKVKNVGRAAIIDAITTQHFIKFESNVRTDAQLFLFHNMAQVKALADLHHYPLEDMIILKTSDYESAYVPKKAERGQVKLWEAVDGYYREARVDLDSYDDPQYYIRAEGYDIVSPGLYSNDLSDTMKTLSQILPEKHVFLFRKTVWEKIPEEWIEVSDKVLSDLVKENPHWWIDFNRYNMAQNGTYLNISRMYIKLYLRFDGRIIRDGYGDEKAVNFEDNLDVLHKFFGRPQLVFANVLYKKDRYQIDLCVISRLISSKSKLGKRIEAASKRARAKRRAEYEKFVEKNKLISWLDWSSVTFRQVAEYLGHTVTPYVEK